MKVLDIIVCILLIIGGLNWGIIGVSDYNVIEHIFGYSTWLTHLIYILVGLSSIWMIFQWSAMRKRG